MQDDYLEALRGLNSAVYRATRAAAAKNAPEYHRLRAMAFDVDQMVDANAPTMKVS